MQRLNTIFKTIHNIDHAKAMLSWDEAVNMPTGGSSARAEAMKELSLIKHTTLKNDSLKDLFAELEEGIETRPAEEQAHLKEMKRIYSTENALPKDLISAKIMATSKCEIEWRHFRNENNWQDFYPLFEEVLKLSREEAEIRSEITGLSKYDSLMNLYEPGASSDKIDLLFNDLREFLPTFLSEVIEKQSHINIIKPDGNFPIKIQKELGQKIMRILGFDFKHGRLDVSDHPFSGGVKNDVRITTRYHQNDFTESLMGIIHETGHGLYDQHLPETWSAFPVGQARGMSMHESQSLLYELQLGRSKSFIHFISPILKKYLGEFQKNESFWELENIQNFYHKVERGFIRTNADEVTYPLHIILRYELEKRMIDGRLEAKDLPEAWNISMKNYFDIDTKNNFKDGCMQDVHWYGGDFGYFPSYTVGAINAAQLYAKISSEHPNLDDEIHAGKFDHITEFLKTNIWNKASFLSTKDLMIEATGEEMNSKFFKEHLNRRYLNK